MNNQKTIIDIFLALEEKRKNNDPTFYEDLLYTIYNNFLILENASPEINYLLKTYLEEILFDNSKKIEYNNNKINKNYSYQNFQEEQFQPSMTFVSSLIGNAIKNNRDKGSF